MNHVIEKGNSRNVIFLLHGTGGDASDLIGIGKMIDEQATLIGLEGNVFEQGMRRFFRRFPDGRFDMESLREETDMLYQTINQLMNHYRLENNNIVLLGYSNGANIAINLLKEFETQFNLAILLHPSLGRGEVEFKKQKNLSIFMTSGQNDPYISGDRKSVV